MPGDILSIPEAAAILGVSRIAVFKRVKSGSIPAFRVGRSWAIARADIKPPAQRSLPTAQPAPAKKPSPPPPAAVTPAREDARTEELDSMGWD